MAALWEAQLVTAAASLPPALVGALLRAGAKAVVCRAGPAQDPDQEPLPDPDTGINADTAVAFFQVGSWQSQPSALPCA